MAIQRNNRRIDSSGRGDDAQPAYRDDIGVGVGGVCRHGVVVGIDIRVNCTNIANYGWFMLAGALVVMCGGISEASNPARIQREMTLPGEHCQIEVRKEWTSAEKWVWAAICEGRSADFNARYGWMDPEDLQLGAERWSSRALSSQFLETILLHDPYRSVIPRQGVQIEGAYYPYVVDLADASISQRLAFRHSRFGSRVDVSRLVTTTGLSFEGSVFLSSLDMEAVKTEGDLSLRAAVFWGEVDISNAEIGGELSLNASRFNGPLYLVSATIRGELFMMEAPIFCTVLLRGARLARKIRGGCDFRYRHKSLRVVQV